CGDVAVRYEWRSRSGLPGERVDILIDGRPAARGFDRAPTTKGGAGVGNVTVTVPLRDGELALIARSGELASEPARVRLTWAGVAPTRGEDLMRPKLYALVIGVGD